MIGGRGPSRAPRRLAPRRVCSGAPLSDRSQAAHRHLTGLTGSSPGHPEGTLPAPRRWLRTAQSPSRRSPPPGWPSRGLRRRREEARWRGLPSRATRPTSAGWRRSASPRRASSSLRTGTRRRPRRPQRTFSSRGQEARACGGLSREATSSAVHDTSATCPERRVHDGADERRREERFRVGDTRGARLAEMRPEMQPRCAREKGRDVDQPPAADRSAPRRRWAR